MGRADIKIVVPWLDFVDQATPETIRCIQNLVLESRTSYQDSVDAVINFSEHHLTPILRQYHDYLVTEGYMARGRKV